MEIFIQRLGPYESHVYYSIDAFFFHANRIIANKETYANDCNYEGYFNPQMNVKVNFLFLLSLELFVFGFEMARFEFLYEI